MEKDKDGMPWVPKKIFSDPDALASKNMAIQQEPRSLEGTLTAKAHAQRTLDVLNEIRDDLRALRDEGFSIHILKNIHRRIMNIEELMRLIKNA